MNITRFCLKVQKSKCNISKLKIQEYIINRYCKSINIKYDKKKYFELVSKEWNNINRNIRSLYYQNDIIALGETNKVKYYIFNESNRELLDKNEISLDILMVYDNENIDYTINFVIKHIKKIA